MEKTAEMLSGEVERARQSDHGQYALDIAEMTQADPTGLLSGRIVDFYNTITASGFVVEVLGGERYDVRVTRAH